MPCLIVMRQIGTSKKRTIKVNGKMIEKLINKECIHALKTEKKEGKCSLWFCSGVWFPCILIWLDR